MTRKSIAMAAIVLAMDEMTTSLKNIQKSVHMLIDEFEDEMDIETLVEIRRIVGPREKDEVYYANRN